MYACDSTDASGVYSISVPGGSYRVQFDPENHYISEYYDDVPLHEYNSYDPVTVSDDTATPNINASLAPGFQVIGQVTEEATGDPLAGIAIYIEGLPNGDIGLALIPTPTASTPPRQGCRQARTGWSLMTMAACMPKNITRMFIVPT